MSLQNKRRSYLLLAVVFLILGVLTAKIGYAHQSDPDKSLPMYIGTIAALAFVLICMKSYQNKFGKPSLD